MISYENGKIKVEGMPTELLTELHLLIIDVIKKMGNDEQARLRVLEGYITGLNCFGKEYLK